jgi:hypothetical protein
MSAVRFVHPDFRNLDGRQEAQKAQNQRLWPGLPQRFASPAGWTEIPHQNSDPIEDFRVFCAFLRQVNCGFRAVQQKAWPRFEGFRMIPRGSFT